MGRFRAIEDAYQSRLTPSFRQQYSTRNMCLPCIILHPKLFLNLAKNKKQAKKPEKTSEKTNKKTKESKQKNQKKQPKQKQKNKRKKQAKQKT